MTDPHFNRDIRAEDGRTLLCLCALGDALRDFGNDTWEPGEDVDRDSLAELVIDAARGIIEQVDASTDERLRRMR